MREATKWGMFLLLAWLPYFLGASIQGDRDLSADSIRCKHLIAESVEVQTVDNDGARIGMRTTITSGRYGGMWLQDGQYHICFDVRERDDMAFVGIHGPDTNGYRAAIGTNKNTGHVQLLGGDGK